MLEEAKLLIKALVIQMPRILNYYELEELNEILYKELADEDIFRQTLIHINRNERLEEFLEIIGKSYYLYPKSRYYINKNGKILVIGKSEVPKD